LKQSIEDARKDNYALGIKLVRGAYHEFEIAAHGSPDTPSISTEFDPPVFLTKAETDECYNSCAKLLIENLKKDVVSKGKLPRIGILFGTHNLHSCQIILEKLVKEDLTRKDDDGTLILEDNVLERLAFGQLLGGSFIAEVLIPAQIFHRHEG
jgi:proline dehydrogenase